MQSFRVLPFRALLSSRWVLSSAALSLGASLGLALSDVASPGYQLTTTPNFAFAAVTCGLPNGDLVTFDGLSVDRWTAGGAHVANLGSYTSFVFPAFLEPTPDGLSVVVADSGSGPPGGNLALAALDGSGMTGIAPLVFPYDGDFLPDGRLIVSAATQGFALNNDIALVELNPPSVTLIGHVATPSGPIEVSRSGDVYYGLQGPGGSPPAGSCSVVRWSAALVNAGGPLDESNALTISTGFDAASSLVFDPDKDRLFLGENHYSLVTHNIWRVKSSKANSILIVTSDQNLSGLRFVDAGGTATFDAYQPAHGRSLAYETTDFWSFSNLGLVTPARPVLSVSGAGTTGVGPVTLTVTGGVPNGSALMTYCPQAAISPSEQVVAFPKFLHHTPFDLSETARFGFLLPADASGTSSVTLWNPGGLEGEFGFQYLVANPNGVAIGSSNAVVF